MSMSAIRMDTRNTSPRCRTFFANSAGATATRGGKTEVVEGKSRSRIVIIEFPSYEAALTCYRSPDYAKAIALRQANADADLIVIEGYDGPQP